MIGSGVFSLIGIGIGYTGKSAWIGILLSAVFILLQALPFIVMAVPPASAAAITP